MFVWYSGFTAPHVWLTPTSGQWASGLYDDEYDWQHHPTESVWLVPGTYEE